MSGCEWSRAVNISNEKKSRKQVVLDEVEMDVLKELIPKNLPEWFKPWEIEVIKGIEERIYKELRK